MMTSATSVPHDAENQGLQHAWEFVEHTGKSIFLTGKAGTGKTTFLKKVCQYSSKRIVVVAPTGVAAINAGGVTIHSFFQLPPTPFVPELTIKQRYDFSKEKRKILRTLDMLVIDEISMVRSDLLDAIDMVMRRYREHDKPFGGVQLLMIGDLQQLTPVVATEEEPILNKYYRTPYFFGSHALSRIDYVTIQLEHVYRQQDHHFLNILNHIRDGRIGPEDIQQLNKRYLPHFTPRPEDGYIKLTTHNQKADKHNQEELEKIEAKAFTFHARIEGTFPEFSYPAAKTLELKVGAQVMFIKNDPSPDHLYYNGKIGHIVYIDDHEIEVHCQDDEQNIKVEMQVWENLKYMLNEETKEIETTIIGKFRQYPLRLAWAITIHKSQGLTFEHAIIDARSSFASGQVYVALSRCKTLEGMVLASPISPHAIINDERVRQYIECQEEMARRSIEQLPVLKSEHSRHLLLELFSFTYITKLEEQLCRLFIEHFNKRYPSLTSFHKQTLDAMTKDIEEVAKKWQAIIRQKTLQELGEEEFKERVRRSAQYFSEKLENTIGTILRLTRNSEKGSKEALKRLDNLCEETHQMYMLQYKLLNTTAQKGFSVKTYLHDKQHFLLEIIESAATDKENTPRRRKNSRNKGNG